MQRKFLLLLAMCALATALPRDKMFVGCQPESDELKEVKSNTTETRIPSKINAIRSATDLETRISQAGDNVVIVFVMTTWCPFSRMVVPKIEHIAAKTENLIVLKVNRDRLEEDDTVWKYGIGVETGVPTFIYIKNGNKLNEIRGSTADIQGTLSNIMTTINECANSSADSGE